MNRLKLFCLNNPAEIYTPYSDVNSLINFLERTGRCKIFSIVAVKGARSLFIERIDNVYELQRVLNEFAVKL